MEREAKAISALQHANLYTLHYSSQDGTNFLVKRADHATP